MPEARTEGNQVDFERLKLALGESVDAGKERYGMTWPGKADCFKVNQQPSLATLRPAPTESVNFDTSGNAIIEGDNLEVLKLLQKSYMGAVKMIYIDPPYNTGNDFIYPDNFRDSLRSYLAYTGQVDEDGRRFGTNTEADGRYHSHWLNMMYPRLYLARNLLREDGIIFVSIDDHELRNLLVLCDEIFGEENHLATFTWETKRAARGVPPTTMVMTNHEYVVAYCREIGRARLRGLGRDVNDFSNPDADPRGPWRSESMKATGKQENHYDIVDPKTGVAYSGNWAFSKATVERMLHDGLIIFPNKPGGVPRQKKFFNAYTNETKAGVTALGWHSTENASKRLASLFAGKKMFDYPKPMGLIKHLCGQTLGRQDLALDFFAGSGTTAQAVLELNEQDHGNRRFILVQLPEPTGREDFPTIADITKERVRRVLYRLNQADAQAPLPVDSSSAPDRGFRVFKLAESNFRPWNPELAATVEGLERQLELHVDHVRHDRTPEDILYEVVLKSGFPLAARIETLTLAGQTVYRVEGGVLLVCLEHELTLKTIQMMADLHPERVVCLDAGFSGNDQLKANAAQIFKTKGVPSFKTV